MNLYPSDGLNQDPRTRRKHDVTSELKSNAVFHRYKFAVRSRRLVLSQLYNLW